MNSIQEMKAAIEAKTAALIAQTKEKAEMAALTAQMKVLDSEAYQQAKVTQAINEAKQTMLTDKIEECKGIISTIPVHDKKTRQDKKWAGRPTYGLGKDIELLHELCSGVLYAVNEHKSLMLANTGLNPNTVEQFLTSLGNASYYSTAYSTIIEEVPYNIEALNQSVMLLGEQLGVVFDATMLTEASMADRFKKAAIKAEKEKLEDELLDPSSHFTMEG